MTATQLRTSTQSRQLEPDAYEHDSTVQNASAIAELIDRYGRLTGTCGRPIGMGRLLPKVVEGGRLKVRSLDLNERTSTKSRLPIASLLEELSTSRGLGWSEIARLCGVSVSAVRKWRAGESISSEHRWSLARLASFLDLLQAGGPVDEPAGWLNMRLSDQTTVTAADLYIAGHTQDLLEHAQGLLRVEQLLDRCAPDWRTASRSEWKIVTLPDGERVLTRRE